MTIHSSILAWKIPWREEPGRTLTMGSQRVGYDRAHLHVGIEEYKEHFYISTFH